MGETILPNAVFNEAYADIVARYLGEEKPHRFIDEKKGLFGKLFGGK